MKKFSFYSSRDIERNSNIWDISAKIMEIRNTYKTFLGILNGREELRKSKTVKKNYIKMYRQK
jgi:hypothetical protein